MGWGLYKEISYVNRDIELARGAPFYNHHLPVVLQHGPTCGIAALSSIILAKDPNCDHVNTANSLLDAALDMDISIQGELMSVWYMAKLAEWAGLNPQVVDLTPNTDIPKLLADSVLLSNSTPDLTPIQGPAARSPAERVARVCPTWKESDTAAVELERGIGE
eukprot:sb/3472691/